MKHFLFSLLKDLTLFQSGKQFPVSSCSSKKMVPFHTTHSETLFAVDCTVLWGLIWMGSSLHLSVRSSMFLANSVMKTAVTWHWYALLVSGYL